MFILNPDPYSLPVYRIGPFKTSDLGINHSIPDNNIIDNYFLSRFNDKEYIYTENGRQAINIALRHYKLKKNDIVSILTTSNNFYISGCVTTEIEKFCKWSRQIVRDTKLIFVNHEFGYPFKKLSSLRTYNLPIIEDCAGSFFSKDPCNEIGNIGDFVIYSFPKMFPIQVGGLLVSNKNIEKLKHTLDNIKLRYIKNVLSYYIDSEEEIIKQRRFNYNYLKERFASFGFTERFVLEEGYVPGVFIFKTDDYEVDLDQLKKYFYSNGVQCSVFYGEKAFFIPVHQALNMHDMDYFFEIMKSFMDNQKKNEIQ